MSELDGQINTPAEPDLRAPSESHDALEKIRQARQTKLTAWRDLDIDPYPPTAHRTETIINARAKAKAGQTDASLTIAGRILALRTQGGVAFLDLHDLSGKLQILIKRDEVEPVYFDRLGLLDLGDIIEASGPLFTTERGELTMKVQNWRLLTKSLHPLPDKWHGLNDPELKYRRHELELIANPDNREIFKKRATALSAIRHFLDERDFVEVSTPVLQNIPGGASAKPFITHYNAYDRDVYLRIAPELYLKRLLVGGFERVYEIGPCFRNEGVDATHNPEYTLFEFYVAYMDEEQLMAMTEELIRAVATAVNGGPWLMRDSQQIKLDAPFRRVTFHDLTNGQADDAVFKQAVRQLTEPTFVTNHPTKLIPLAKRSDNPDTVRSFQLVIAGIELVKAFAELNDPLDQRHRFEEQEQARLAGDEEAQHLDEEFIAALETGMPPAAGFGMGIERLLVLLTGQHAIREVILFPYVRPKDEKRTDD